MSMLKKDESILKVRDQVKQRQKGSEVADQVNCLIKSSAHRVKRTRSLRGLNLKARFWHFVI